MLWEEVRDGGGKLTETNGRTSVEALKLEETKAVLLNIFFF